MRPPSDSVPAPPVPALGPGWTLRPLDDPAAGARSYAVTAADGGPALRLRVHRVARHPVRACYPYGGRDLALEPGSWDDPGPLARLLRAFVPALLAADPDCRRVVAAPDEDDAAAHAVLEAGGLLRVTEAELPDGAVVLFAAEPPNLAGMSTALDDMPH
jgi:hypothetical protein